MASFIVGRTRARSQAVQVVFQAEAQGVDVFDLLEGGEYVLEDGPIDKYALQLARGVAVNRLSIDRLMGGLSHNWNLSRMPRVDRCIMAVALYEMFFVDDIPVSVSINEAVELSKVYGTDDSFSFVNGILGRVARLADENPGVPMAELARQVAEQAQAAQAPGDEVAAGQAAEGEPAAAEKTAEGEDEPAQADPEPAVQPDPEPAARDDEQAADDPA